MRSLFRQLFGARAPEASLAPPPVSAADRAGCGRCRSEGNTHLAAGRLDDAANSYAQALACDPGDALAHLNLGYVQLEQAHHAQALENLERAATLAPTLSDAPYLIGRAQQESGRL